MLRGERENRRGLGKAQGKERRGLWKGECTWREGRRRSGKGGQGRGGRYPFLSNTCYSTPLQKSALPFRRPPSPPAVPPATSLSSSTPVTYANQVRKLCAIY